MKITKTLQNQQFLLIDKISTTNISQKALGSENTVPGTLSVQARLSINTDESSKTEKVNEGNE